MAMRVRFRFVLASWFRRQRRVTQHKRAVRAGRVGSGADHRRVRLSLRSVEIALTSGPA